MNENTKSKGASSTLIIVIIVVIIIAVLGFFYFSDSTAPTVDVGLGEEAQLDEEEIETLVDAVRRHIVLPEDEEPLVATIVNVDELIAEQAFYQGAQNGDVLIIYGSVAKALIYNPREDRLVNVGPVEVQQDAPSIPTQETTLQ